MSDVKADDMVTILAKKGDADALMAVKIEVSWPWSFPVREIR